MNQEPLLKEMVRLSIADVKKSQPSPKQSHRNLYSRISRMSRISVHNLRSALFYIRENWKSGMTQALLNMPFILNAGNNTGGDPSVALTSAFIGAFVNGFFSGSNHSIYAPTWVAAGYNYHLVQRYGFEAIPWVTIIIGLSIYAISHFKWHHLIDFMPNYVIEGFYLGLGFLIFNGYIDYAFGLCDMHANRGITVYPDRLTMYEELFRRGDYQYLFASFVVFFYLYLGNKVDSKFPWILTTSCTGVFLGVLFPTDRCLRSVYGNVRMSLQFIESSGTYFDISTSLFDLIIYSVPMTFYITVQNLICAKGSEAFTGVKCDNDEEMICVSITNIISGIFGGIPICASIRLLILNIKIKNNNKWSSILNALSILIFYGLFCPFFLDVPLYIVSGHLLFCAYSCPTWSYLEMLVRTRRRSILLKQLTIAVLCIYYGAMESTIIGSMYAMLLFAEKMSAASSEILIQQESSRKGSAEFKQSMIRQKQGQDIEVKNLVIHDQDDLPDAEFPGSFSLYRFNGSLNYINVRNHVASILKLPDTDYIVLSFRYVSMFDDEAIDKLAQLIKSLICIYEFKSQAGGREVLITGVNDKMVYEMTYNEYFRIFFKKYKKNIKYIG